MSTSTLNTDELEQVYDHLAQGITAAGSAKESLFLTKLALLLANQVGNGEEVVKSIDEALKNL